MKAIERSQLESQLEKVKVFFDDVWLRRSMPMGYNWSTAYGYVLMTAFECNRIPRRPTVVRWLRDGFCPNGHRVYTTVKRIAILNGYSPEQLTTVTDGADILDYPFSLSLELNDDQRKWIDLNMNKDYR